MAEVTITVAEPDLAAALALFAAVVAIDLVAIRRRKSTVSRWVRHQYRHRPALTLTAMVLLAAHLSGESRWDPFIWAAHHLGQGAA